MQPIKITQDPLESALRAEFPPPLYAHLSPETINGHRVTVYTRSADQVSSGEAIGLYSNRRFYTENKRLAGLLAALALGLTCHIVTERKSKDAEKFNS